jgi:FAD/FMN-containing dehydrogenase
MRDRSAGHRALSHAALSWLAYDWERVGDPTTRPRWPFKVYLPRSTEEVVRAVREAAAAGERLIVRGSGHSSNGLVTAEGGAVLLTELMDRVVEIDERAGTCTMQAGVRLGDVDRRLAERGLGLKVVGDHGDLTAGGFASVGGISPASHRFGLFADTVSELEYVDFAGEVHRCGRTDPAFRRILAGLGRHGVITELTVEVLRIDKRRTLLRNDRIVTGKLPEFLAKAAEMVVSPGQAWYARAFWIDLGKAGCGQISRYHPAAERADRVVRSRLARGCQRAIGAATAFLPRSAAAVAKYAGVAAMVLPPVYTTADRVERFADELADATVGAPTRMFITIAPAEAAAEVARGMLEACAAARRAGAIGPLTLYFKPIRSAYLSGDQDGVRHAEITVTATVDPARMTERVLSTVVERIDDVALAHGAFRYLHTRTGSDPHRRRRLDPNARYGDEESGPEARWLA